MKLKFLSYFLVFAIGSFDMPKLEADNLSGGAIGGIVGASVGIIIVGVLLVRWKLKGNLKSPDQSFKEESEKGIEEELTQNPLGEAVGQSSNPNRMYELMMEFDKTSPTSPRYNAIIEEIQLLNKPLVTAVESKPEILSHLQEVSHPKDGAELIDTLESLKSEPTVEGYFSEAFGPGAFDGLIEAVKSLPESEKTDLVDDLQARTADVTEVIKTDVDTIISPAAPVEEPVSAGPSQEVEEPTVTEEPDKGTSVEEPTQPDVSTGTPEQSEGTIQVQSTTSPVPIEVPAGPPALFPGDISTSTQVQTQISPINKPSGLNKMTMDETNKQLWEKMEKEEISRQSGKTTITMDYDEALSNQKLILEPGKTPRMERGTVTFEELGEIMKNAKASGVDSSVILDDLRSSADNFIVNGKPTITLEQWKQLAIDSGVTAGPKSELSKFTNDINDGLMKFADRSGLDADAFKAELLKGYDYEDVPLTRGTAPEGDIQLSMDSVDTPIQDALNASATGAGSYDVAPPASESTGADSGPGSGDAGSDIGPDDTGSDAGSGDIGSGAPIGDTVAAL
jgi:hypothetical protein